VKLCIIGNSHVACLKSAWDALPRYHEEFDCAFFGSPGAGMNALYLEDGRLKAGTDKLRQDLRFTSGGQEAVRIGDYDAFLIVGVGFHTPSHDRRVSSAVLHAALRGMFGTTMAGRFASAIRIVTQAPVLICATPLKATAGGSRRRSPALLEPAEVSGLLSSAYSAERFRFLAQPSSTLENPWATRREFVVDAPRLAHVEQKIGGRFTEGQNVHMNAEYGRLYLQSVFAALLEGVSSASAGARASGEPGRRLPRLIPSIRGFLGKLSLRPR
jgi:hypothetical protein